jgi:hypothetical protein
MLTKKEAIRLEEIETRARENVMNDIYLEDYVADEDIEEYNILTSKRYEVIK